MSSASSSSQSSQRLYSPKPFAKAVSVIFVRSGATVCMIIFSNRLAIEKIAGRGERRIAQRVNLDSEPKMEMHLHQKVDGKWPGASKRSRPVQLPCSQDVQRWCRKSLGIPR